MLLNRCLFVLLLLMAGNSYAQPSQPPPLQKVLTTAIRRAYPAAVRAYGWDTARKQQNSAQFSAVAVTADGYLLTVAHAVQPNRTYRVSFPDGKDALAVALGRIDLAASRTMPDVAMMKILGNGPWPYAEMGTAAAVEKGTPCFSIAYPETLAQLLPDIRFGYVEDGKLTSGFILSSSAMEPGDSGGPLFDLQGRVIALHSRCDTLEDRNYHVPVDIYRKYWTALQKAQHYTEYPAADEPVAMVTPGLQPSFKPPVKALVIANAAVVSLQSELNGKSMDIAGTAIVLRGITYILSKSSCLGEKPVLKGRNGLPVRVVARSREHDLVLLKVNEKLPGALSAADTSYGSLSPAAGDLIYAALPGGRQESGIAGAAVFALPAKFSSGYFGANAQWQEGAATFSNIQPNSPVLAAGLALKDKVLRIAGQPVNKPADYGALLQQFFPDDTIVLEVKRGDSVFQRAVVLAPRPERRSNHPADHFAGGKSERRDGFPAVWPVDARIKAAECGSPLYDKQGRFCGMAISRFSRTVTLVLPPAIINSWIISLIK